MREIFLELASDLRNIPEDKAQQFATQLTDLVEQIDSLFVAANDYLEDALRRYN